MNKTLRFLPGEATQEAINQIEMDASKPAPDFASKVPTSKNTTKGTNTIRSVTLARPTSFHRKNLK